MVKIKHYSRKFLNKSTGLSAIETSIDTTLWSGGVEGSVSITDCARQVNLDFSLYDVKDVDVKIAKLNLLLVEISAFRDVYLQHYDEIKDNLSKKEKERKKLQGKKNELQ
jgi:hypothetical protein